MDLKEPLISVILPVYNVEKYILEAINSILNQTIKDFELLVIDDCSIDNTVSIIENIIDDRIILVKKESNKGLIDSLNLGFKMAKGKYISRMDGDDISVPERFEKQVKVLVNNPNIDACGSWMKSFGSKSDRVLKYKEYHQQILPQFLISNPMSMGSIMLVKESFKKFKFDKTKVHVEDFDFWARSAFVCVFYNIQEVLYYYRTHDNQVSTKYKLLQLQGDMPIMLSMFHKIEYDRSRFTDEFVKKVLFSKESLILEEYQKFFSWMKELINRNRIKENFDQKELRKVLNTIRRKFVFEIFFTDRRNGLNYNLRKEILFILPLKEKVYVLTKKIKEKYLK